MQQVPKNASSKKRLFPQKKVKIRFLYCVDGVGIGHNLYDLSVSTTHFQARSCKVRDFCGGIFDTTSFLPYLRNDDQSRFYQGLLYKRCLSYEVDGHEVEYKDEMCHVTTPDYQQYFVSLIPGIHGLMESLYD